MKKKKEGSVENRRLVRPLLCFNSPILLYASRTCLCTSRGLGRKDVRVAMVDFRERKS